MIDDIEAALEARVNSLPGETIAWWGRPFSPVKGVPYVAAQITSRSAQPVAIGANAPEFWDGTLQLLVAHPMSEGQRVARQRAQAIRDHFPRALTLISNAARVMIMARTVQPAVAGIDWINTPVIISWLCEEIPA